MASSNNTKPGESPKYETISVDNLRVLDINTPVLDDLVALTEASTPTFHGGLSLQAVAPPATNNDDLTRAKSVNPSMDSASRMTRKASRSFDRSRVPLKKRQTSPMPAPPGLAVERTSASIQFVQPVPLLNASSSAFGIVPPQLCLSSSRGTQLMSEPLLETPNSITFLWPQTSVASLGRQISLSGFPSSNTPIIHGMPSSSSGTPGSAGFYYTPLEINNAERAMIQRQMVHLAASGPNTNRYGQQPVLKSVPVTASRSNELDHSTKFQPHHHYYHSYAAPYGRGLATPRPVVTERPPFTHNVPYSAQNEENRHVSAAPRASHDDSGPGRNLFENVPLTDRPCKCSNSRCLKLYCECFHYGYFCDIRMCKCRGCLNNEEHNQPRGERIIAVKTILARRPHAFSEVRVRKRTGKGCGCKKSG
jgi:hypothetical protein